VIYVAIGHIGNVSLRSGSTLLSMRETVLAIEHFECPAREDRNAILKTRGPYSLRSRSFRDTMSQGFWDT
jgi:hypothetical protein